MPNKPTMHIKPKENAMTDLKPTYTSKDGSTFDNAEQARARNALLEAEEAYTIAQQTFQRAILSQCKTADGQTFDFRKTYYYPRSPLNPRVEILCIDIYWSTEFLIEPNTPPRIVYKDLTFSISELFESKQLAAKKAKEYLLQTFRDSYNDAYTALRFAGVDLNIEDITQHIQSAEPTIGTNL